MHYKSKNQSCNYMIGFHKRERKETKRDFYRNDSGVELLRIVLQNLICNYSISYLNRNVKYFLKFQRSNFKAIVAITTLAQNINSIIALFQAFIKFNILFITINRAEVYQSIKNFIIHSSFLLFIFLISVFPECAH